MTKIIGYRKMIPPGWFRVASRLGVLRRLFNGGEEGSLIQPLGQPILFQDSAGTTPVDAYGDPVGLAEDQSGNGDDANLTARIQRNGKNG